MQVGRLFISFSVKNGKNDKEMGTKHCCDLPFTEHTC